MAYIDAYPDASNVQSTDIVILGQRGIANVPGSAITTQATLAQILGSTPGNQYLPLIGGIVTGSTTFSGAGTGLAVTNNQTIGGTLGVTGTTNLAALSASGTVSGAGFTSRFSAPGPIGDVTPSTGAFTTLAVSGAVSGAGVVARFATPGPIGSTLADTALFTTLGSSGTASIGSGSSVRLTLAGGASSASVSATAGTFVLALQPGGSPTTVGGRIAQSLGSGFNLTSNNIVNAASLFNYSNCFAQNSGGSGSPLIGLSYVNSYNVADQAFTTGGGIFGWQFTHAIAPNSNSASGARCAMTVTLVAPTGGTITNGGIHTGFQANAWSFTNYGGTSGRYSGTLNGANIITQIGTGATFMQGASTLELDMNASGGSYDELLALLISPLATHQIAGYTNTNGAIGITGQVGARADLMFGLKFGDQASGLVMDSYGKIIFQSQGFNNTRQTLATAVDVSYANFKSPAIKMPYWQELSLQATAITGVTRLTTDGATANGFVYDMIITNSGTGYTSHPTYTPSAGTGVVLHSETAGINNIIARPGVFTPGSAVPSDTTASVSGTGTSGAVALTISGNTLNFPPNSMISVDIVLVATTLTHSGTDAVSWKIAFLATMAATVSTTTIVGSPTWTLIDETTGAAAKFSGSSPAVPVADITLGAVNLSVTPTTGTWDVRARAVMVWSARS